MKRIKLLTTALLAACLLAGCGGGEEESVSPIEGQPINTEAPVQSSESEETGNGEEETDMPVADTATIGERTVVDGKMQSYLTGEWKDEEVVRRRSMAVMIGNNKGILPQYGISQASIIYEAPVEGRISRLMAFFEDYDDLDHIGPVRSARDYYVYEAMGLDAIYCNWGLAIPFVEDLLAGDEVDNISQAVSGIHNASAEAYDRISRGEGYKTEYTGYLFIDGYNKAVDRQGYDTDYDADFSGAFLFANDGHRAEYADMPDATKIYPGGTNSNRSGYGSAQPVFEYNAEDGLYYRYQYSGKHIDEMNGEQLTVSNVVFKICDGVIREPIANDYMYFKTHGSNDAYVFTNGKVIKGTWSRSTESDVTRFFDEDGNEIVFNQGKTWICNIWSDYTDCMEWE